MAAGEVTNPSGTEKLHEYWVHGEGAAKIAWGTPGDFDRCVRHLEKYIRDPKGYCAKAHHDALGIWPAQHAAMEKHDTGRPGMERADSPKPYGNVKYADPKNGKYPIDTAAHAKAAWSYINQPDNAAKYPMNGVTLSSVKARIKAACKKFGITISEDNSGEPGGEYRTVPFDVASAEANGDGLTFEGYAAVYDMPTRISGLDEDFDEQIAPGAFRSIADGNYPVLMFEHGRHPLIGTMPLGRITDAREDPQGLFISARLTDNWLIAPVRDAVRDRALTGMSFRFTVDGDGDTWLERSGDVPLRTLHSVSVPELGPVVFPAYEPTTASVRSQLDRLPVIGRPPAGARAANDREGGTPGNGAPPVSLLERFGADGLMLQPQFSEADSMRLAMYGLKGAKNHA
ncbi:MAG: HK97 family phage prohead protease [Actinobacteria bacterium]|nr:HK97 family phage prohead protease [Actinomycetota bacterium]